MFEHTLCSSHFSCPGLGIGREYNEVNYTTF